MCIIYINFTVFLYKYFKHVCVDLKECISLIADHFSSELQPLVVKTVNSSLLSIDGARLQVLTGRINLTNKAI